MVQLLKYLKNYKKEAILTPVLVALEAVGELCLTLIIGRLIDQLSDSGTTMGTIWSYGLRLLLVALLCLILGTISGLTSTKAAAGLSKNLRDEMFSRIQDFSFTNIDKFSTNSLVTRMTTDVMNVQNAVMMILRVAAKAPIAIVCALVMAFFTNWQIGLIYVVLIPVLFVCLMIIARRPPRPRPNPAPSGGRRGGCRRTETRPSGPPAAWAETGRRCSRRSGRRRRAQSSRRCG